MPINSPIAHLEIWERRNNGDKQKAIESLCTIYLRIVKYVAGRMAIGLPHYIEFNDLISAGLFGLLQAIDNFDYQRGIKFETYAIPRIRGNILDELRSQDWFPRSVRRKSKHLEEAQSTLNAKLNRPANDDELAEYLSISLEQLEDMRACNYLGKMKFLDVSISGEDDENSDSLVDCLPAKNEDPIKMVIREENLHLMHSKISELPEQEQQVLVLYYYKELTLKEIGKIYDVTESRISQIHTQAIARLRKKINRRPLPRRAPKFHRSSHLQIQTLNLNPIPKEIISTHKALSNAHTKDTSIHVQLISLLSQVNDPQQLADDLLEGLKINESKGIYNLLTLADTIRASKHRLQFEETNEGLKASFIIELN